jgi:hypothetical protein
VVGTRGKSSLRAQREIVGNEAKSHTLSIYPIFSKSSSSTSFLLLFYGLALTSSDSDNICALPSSVYSGGSHCGKWVTIRNADTGAQTAVSQFPLFSPSHISYPCLLSYHLSHSLAPLASANIQCMVADSCPSCGSSSDIDLSKNVFGQLTNWDYGQGVVNVEWFFQ